MKKLSILFVLFLLGACGKPSLPSIDPSVKFVASLNTIEGTIDFISEEQEVMESWQLDAAYTGFTLVSDDLLLLYGFTLEEAVLIQLSTGKQLATLDVREGTTFAYAYEENIYIANGKENTVSLFDQKGELLAEAATGNYPMSMIAQDGDLYVVNFKDEILSIFSLNLTEKTKWDIPSSSHGILVNGNELWLGGHGAGSSPNRVIKRYNIKTGELLGEIEAPMMPIDMTEAGNGHIFAVSHGSSTVYDISKTGEVLASMKAGANPFSIATFGENIVLAGYDDHQLYFIHSGKVTNKLQVGKGPFQLVVREVSK
ncbi:YncE family protein [Psychrobacillus lasiicapitis]|uniref:WD40 repeat domain-containing protein n=1 Tax=Psychrobacillus lasiicapitis TaxID=1636719 RepID=A0A544SVB9_9BACI|nr:hypothetical protein [Psychrobacillus lasiicapitis]TQR09143.1 hypothetical protein FG382_20310 [Psychrobacillus lasiicapitis]GGA47834.1 hypothetical protein GCM10011384_41940 [Psychrobacillus lasiicapitis]